MMWNRSDIQFCLNENDFYFLHVHASKKNMEHWFLIVVYASPRENEIDNTWQLLQQLATSINKLWLMT